MDAARTETEALLPRLAEVLSDARFAYVFGSVVTERFGPDSDLDVAVDFGRRLRPEERAALAGVIESLAGHAADIVDLFRADPIIRMQVLRRGRLIVEKNRRARHEFELRTLSEYLDFKIDRAPVEAALIGTGRG
jgi:uncharacterized protein